MTTRDVMLASFARQAAESGLAAELREVAKLSQAEVGEACWVSAAAVSRWEAGIRSPRGLAAIRYGRLLRALAEAREKVAA